MGWADGVVSGLAERQHGVVSRRQLLDAGLRRREIGSRIERGSLHPIHRGVYAVGYPRGDIRARWMAAVLAMGPEALLSHRSAVGLWGLIPPARTSIEITRPRNCRLRDGIVVHRSNVPGDERTAIDGIPVTSFPRAILDFAVVGARWQVERALHEAEVQQLTDRLSVPDLLERYPGKRGTAVLRAVLGGDGRSGFTRNDFEERFARLVDEYRLPRPRFNADLAIGGRFFNVDCLWSEARLIVELDGREAHETRRAFEEDRERDRLLLTHGWRVMRVTWRQLRDREPAIAADLKRLLG